MDGLVFGEFMEHLSKTLQKAIDEADKDDTLSMHSLFKPEASEKERPPDEEEFLRLHDGNYLTGPDAPPKSTDI